jgi:hypothetical protein
VSNSQLATAQPMLLDVLLYLSVPEAVRAVAPETCSATNNVHTLISITVSIPAKTRWDLAFMELLHGRDEFDEDHGSCVIYFA